MAGKKQFDENVALDRATETFRRKGFVACSVDDLVDATGLSRSSLYATFGNKEALFVRVLDRYCAQMMARLVLDREKPPEQAVEAFLLDLLDTLESWGEHEGCLVTTTCGEFRNAPLAAQQRCATGLGEQFGQLRDYFALAGERGDLPVGVDTEQLAHYFVAVRQSLAVLWRAGTPKATLADVVRTSVAVLRREPVSAKRRPAAPVGRRGFPR